MLAIIATTVFWGLSFSSTKVLLTVLTPSQILFCRLVLAVLVLGLVRLMRTGTAIERKDWLRVAAGGALGIFVYFILENTGMQYTTAGTASLIVSTAPVLNVIAGTMLFGERHGIRRWAGVILSFVGVYLIIIYGDAALSLAHVKGNVMIFLAACTWVAFTRINEPLMHKYDNLSINVYQSIVGALMFGAIVLPEGFKLANFNAKVVMNLVYLGLFCSAAAFFFYLHALKHLGAAVTTSFLNLVPVFGVFGGALFLKEVLMPGQIAGGIIAITGVTLVTMSDRKRGVVACAKSGREMK
jgi:drug/metabolite transporter (DMT)-like permease